MLHQIKISLPFIISTFVLLLIFTSCGEESIPDPCIDVFCVKDDCNNGTCSCEEGWIGARCQMRDFSGEWRMIQYTTIDCSDYFYTDIRNDGSTRQLCGKAEEFDVCYETNMILKTDMTFSRIDNLYLHNDDGSIETIFETSETGTWAAEEADTKLRTRTNGDTGFRLFEMNSTMTEMSRVHNQADGGLNCKLETAFKKV